MKDINATIIVNIKNKTQEEILRGLEYSRRKNIKKATQSGLIIEKTDSEEDYKKCYELYSKIILEGGSTPFIYEVWRNWAREENWDLFAIKKEGKSVGYFSVIEIDESYYGIEPKERGIRPRVFASDREYEQYRVNDLIYWGTILYGIDKKASFVDLGGYQINPREHLKGVNNFKEKWGGKVYYYNLDYPIYISIARKLIRKFDFLWNINEKRKSKNQKAPPPFTKYKNKEI
jgi:hypothetical protein